MKISKHAIYAADEDDFETGFDDFDDEPMDDDEDIEDTLDGIADDIEDMQDDLDEIQEDDPNIEIDNNIDGHYIAECDKCHEIFISAVIESDQEIENIKGTCPVCGKESEQYLKWVIKKVE